MKSAVLNRCKKALSVLAAASVILASAVFLSNNKAYAWESNALDKANVNGDFSGGLDDSLVHTADTSSVAAITEDGNVKVSVKRNRTDAKTGSLSKSVSLPAGDYVWQFELNADNIPTESLKYLIYFGVFNKLGGNSRGYGTNGIAAAATYISGEAPAENNYCYSLAEYNYNFYLTNRSLKNSSAYKSSDQYYIAVSFSLKEEKTVYLSMTNVNSEFSVITDNWYIYSAENAANAESFEYYRPKTYDNFSYDTNVKRSGYRSLKCVSRLGNTQTLQPIYDSFGCN